MTDQTIMPTTSFSCDRERGIITGANSQHWLCLAALAIGAHRNKVGFAVADHGLEDWQRQELERIGVLWIEHEYPKLPTDSKRKTSVPVQAWLKPWIFQCSPFKKSLWLDSDSIIIDNINELFDLFPCVGSQEFWKTGTKVVYQYGSEEISRILYGDENTNKHLEKLKFINTGVVGFDKDDSLIKEWIDISEKILNDKELFEICYNNDQSAYIFAVLKRLIDNKKIPLILDCKYNYPADGLNYNNVKKRKTVNNRADIFLKESKDRHPNVKIVHWMYLPKPWDLIKKDNTKYDSIDILLPLGTGSKYNNLEVRMALRSIEKNAIGYRRVYIIGFIPDFLYESKKLKLIPLKEFKCNKESRISQKVKWAFENLDLTPRIAFWNDDYLLLQKTDVRLIPNYFNRGLGRRKKTGYQRCLNSTFDFLKSKNLPTNNYDIHTPIIYEKDNFLSISDQWDESMRNSAGFVAKSIYGNNFCDNDKKPLPDFKLKANWEERIESAIQNNRWLISYSDDSLNSYFDLWMEKFLPDISSFEKETVKINDNELEHNNNSMEVWKELHERKVIYV